MGFGRRVLRELVPPAARRPLALPLSWGSNRLAVGAAHFGGWIEDQLSEEKVMAGRKRVERGGSKGFNFSRQMSRVCEDMVARLPELRHIDMSRVAVSISQARKRGPYGVHASLTPMRFEGGARAGKRRGRYYRSQLVTNDRGQEMLYILTFYLPRFMDVVLREKLVTVAHELWHISPAFDGDLRRHEGRCYAHTGSREQYDERMGRLVDRWLSLAPPPELYGFLNYRFEELHHLHGRVFGIRYARPKLLPISAAQAQLLNRELPPRRAS